MRRRLATLDRHVGTPAHRHCESSVSRQHGRRSDGVLWYLPIEASADWAPIMKESAVDAASDSLCTHFVAGLCPIGRGNRPLARTAVAARKVLPRDEDVFAKAMVRPLVRRSQQPPLSQRAVHFLGDFLGRFDRLVVPPMAKIQRSCHLVGRRFHSTPAKWGARWPTGDNFPLAASINRVARLSHRGRKQFEARRHGDEMFLAVCGLMASGCRTILISRWRVGGQSTVDLISRIRSRIAASIGRSGLAAERATRADRLLDPSLEGRLKPSPAAADSKPIIRSSGLGTCW